MLEKKCWKKIVEKSFDKKNIGKINYKTKIFITKIYSNIDKWHTIFALPAPFDKKQGERRVVMKTSVAYDSNCRALALDARNVAIWMKSEEKIYHGGLRAVGNSLTTWTVSLNRWYEILVPGSLPR